MSRSRDQINRYLSQIDISGKRVLDVGVQNNPASDHTKGVAGEYRTLDIDQEWGADYVLDLNNSWKLNGKSIGNYDDMFDVVFCLEVLEHCWDPITAIRNLGYVTKEGGVCYISTPFINPIHDKWDFLRYTPEWFEKVLPMVGFKGWEIKYRMAEGNKILEFYQEEGLRMSKIRHEMGDGQLLKLVGVFVEAYK